MKKIFKKKNEYDMATDCHFRHANTSISSIQHGAKQYENSDNEDVDIYRLVRGPILQGDFCLFTGADTGFQKGGGGVRVTVMY